ncbi:nuclear pore complex protein NUP1 isoform X2 [Olea europaea var. sylvestris]|uniref:nuclear pore complex protein NUP1 isoform X2 n=1 Tax=Olea europaea var. sylvestris TaxID=158386 RepID=UPI000C1D59BC|nr:nuclear pore complex protein NUP1 isoform X2 [Olea europaea var. sylvestris]
MDDTKKTVSLYVDNGYEGRGAGGKFRKPSGRKLPAKPYYRPPPTNNQNGRGWLSKIVDPACRLITGGATKIFPLFFSKSASSPALPLSENNDRPDAELPANAEDSVNGSTSSLPFRSAEIGGPSEVADGLNLVFDHNEFGQDKVKTSSDGTDFSRFEQLLKGKTFSKEEINHLLEILNSRVDMEGEKKNPSGEDAERVLLTQEIPRTPVEERQQDTNRPLIGTPIQKSDVTRSPKIPRTPLERKQEDRDRLIATSLQKADVKDAIGASPVDIAQAYMGSCTSERGHDPYSFMSKSRRAQQFSNEFATKPIMPPPSPKPSICWPGAEVHDGRGYVTPQSQRGRYGHFDFPRTPYSRTIASKSRDKADSKFQNRSSTPFQQAHTSIYGQVKWG